MKLYFSATSPYARKVRIVMMELGLTSQVEPVLVSPLEPGAERIVPNPLGKVPTLLLDDGCAAYDSLVICQDLLAEHDIPPTDRDTLRRHALGDGMIDAAFSAVMERRRPEEQQSPMWLNRWEAAISRSLDAMEQECDALPPEFGLAAIT